MKAHNVGTSSSMKGVFKEVWLHWDGFQDLYMCAPMKKANINVQHAFGIKTILSFVILYSDLSYAKGRLWLVDLKFTIPHHENFLAFMSLEALLVMMQSA